MSKFLFSVPIFLSVCIYGDEPLEKGISEECAASVKVVPMVQSTPASYTLAEAHFPPFTGRIRANKVRMRVQPDMESRVIQELSSNQLVMVVGEKGDFYAVEPPAGTKAYIFRSFVLDGVVEGERVNVRLEPSLDSPVIGHLNTGDRIRGKISLLNNKWYEIFPPAGSHFFIAKEYVDSIGGPEVKLKMDKRRLEAMQTLDMALLLTQSEMQKPFREIDLIGIKGCYQTLFKEYADFPELCIRGKESFSAFQEEYLQKKIAYLEQKNGETLSSTIPLICEEEVMIASDRMKVWEPVEEALYLSWAYRNEERSLEEFYQDERGRAITITGILEAYSDPVKKKPGDFLLKNKNVPIAYLYSTLVNLKELIDREVSLEVVGRENNNFAFPAYFVLSVEGTSKSH